AGARLPVAPPGRVGPASEAPLQGRDGGQRRGARRPPSRARSAAAPLPVRGQPAASARTSLPEAYWALEYVDGLIGRLLGALPAGALDHTTVFVLSDHGFLPSTREIRPNVRLRRLGAL